VTKGAFASAAGHSRISPYLIKNINLFGELNGFELIVQRLGDSHRRLSVNSTTWILKSIYSVRSLYCVENAKIIAFLKQLERVCYCSDGAILGLPDAEFKVGFLVLLFVCIVVCVGWNVCVRGVCVCICGSGGGGGLHCVCVCVGWNVCRCVCVCVWIHVYADHSWDSIHQLLMLLVSLWLFVFVLFLFVVFFFVASQSQRHAERIGFCGWPHL
jgi:hypothetical protein